MPTANSPTSEKINSIRNWSRNCSLWEVTVWPHEIPTVEQMRLPQNFDASLFIVTFLKLYKLQPSSHTFLCKCSTWQKHRGVTVSWISWLQV